MKKLNKIRWEVAKALKSGEEIIMKPTTKCNFVCPYCFVNKAKNRQPIYDEMPWQYWISRIKGIKRVVKTVTISGGEPALYKDITKLICELNKMNINILVFTNLSIIKPFMDIPKSWRTIFLVSYHPSGISKEKFIENYNKLSNKFYVTVREVKEKGDNDRAIPFSKINEMKKDQNDTYVRVYAPDGRIFYSCKQLDEGGR